jgi:hypothetical protein
LSIYSPNNEHHYNELPEAWSCLVFEAQGQGS